MSSIAIPMTPVESSQIHSIGHDDATNTLAVRFKNTKGFSTSLYHYGNFSADDFAALKAAESTGSHFIRNIKANADKHPFRKIEEPKAA